MRWTAIAWVLLLAALAPGRAWGQSTSGPADQAELEFEIGVDLSRRGDHRGALARYFTSYRLVANLNVLYNIARSYEELGRALEAYRYYSDYLAGDAPAQDRALAEQALQRLRPRVGLLHIVTDPPGARIYIEREDLGERGTTPATVVLADGSYRILLERDDYHTEIVEQARVRTGEATELSVGLRLVTGRVRVTGSPAGAELRIDDEHGPIVGRIPATLEVRPGQRTVWVSAARHESRGVATNVQRLRTSEVSVRLAQAPGSLVVTSSVDGALVEVDGRPAGFTPAVIRSVATGRRLVRVSHANLRPEEVEVEVRSDRTARVAVELRALEEISAASRVTEAVDAAPASVSLISREELRAFGHTTVADALAGTRGIYLSDDRTYRFLGIRGFSRLGDYNNRVLLLLDGHTVNDDWLGSSYIGQDLLSGLEDVERIEVVRGPGSALYGTNAFFGLINLVTRRAAEANRAELALGFDGARSARAYARGGGRLSPRVGGWLSVGGVVSQGEDLYLPEFDDASSDGVSRGADGFSAGTVELRGTAGDLSVSGHHHTRDKHIPTGAFDTILADERARSIDSRSFLELRWEPAPTPSVRLFTRATLDRYAFDGYYPYEPEPGETRDVVLHDSWRGLWTGLEARAVLEPGPWLRLTAGAEGRASLSADLHGEDDQGVAYVDEDATYRALGVYGVGDLRPAPWLGLSLSGRFDTFSDGPELLSPRAALILRPREGSTLKLVGGRAFRAPSVYELRYNDGGVTTIPPPVQLDPETIITAETEFTQRVGQTVLVVGAFWNEIENLIDTTSDEANPDVFFYANSRGRIHTLGGEVEVARHLRDRWMVSASYSYQRTRRGSLLSTDPEDRLSNSPEHVAAVKAIAPLSEHILLATRVAAESPRLRRDGTSGDPVLLVDVGLTGEIERIHLRWTLGIRNLLDWEYGVPGGADLRPIELPQSGRQLHGSAALSW